MVIYFSPSHDEGVSWMSRKYTKICYNLTMYIYRFIRQLLNHFKLCLFISYLYIFKLYKLKLYILVKSFLVWLFLSVLFNWTYTTALSVKNQLGLQWKSNLNFVTVVFKCYFLMNFNLSIEKCSKIFLSAKLVLHNAVILLEDQGI